MRFARGRFEISYNTRANARFQNTDIADFERRFRAKRLHYFGFVRFLLLVREVIGRKIR